MKSSHSLVRSAFALAALSSLLLLGACGQKGPLYMPKVPPEPQARTAPKSDVPVAPAADGDKPAKPAGTAQ